HIKLQRFFKEKRSIRKTLLEIENKSFASKCFDCINKANFLLAL
ncbi:hypothetical protein HMPREF1433_00597, partial [Helicobacter pylori GAMchJs117Ai]